MFRGAATASAKALRQDMFRMFKDYQGGQCGRVQVYEEGIGDKGQAVMGCGFCCIPMLHGAPVSFYAECTGNQRRVLNPCLVQSNFHPIQKPERDLAWRGQQDALL